MPVRLYTESVEVSIRCTDPFFFYESSTFSAGRHSVVGALEAIVSSHIRLDKSSVSGVLSHLRTALRKSNCTRFMLLKIRWCSAMSTSVLPTTSLKEISLKVETFSKSRSLTHSCGTKIVNPFLFVTLSILTGLQPSIPLVIHLLVS